MKTRSSSDANDSPLLTVVFAGMDATREVKTAAAYSVQGYPMLKLFKSAPAIDLAGEMAEAVGPTVLDYRGARTAAALVKWLERKMGPTCTIVTTKEQLTSLVASNGVVIVGFFEDSDNDDSKLFEAVAAANEASRYVFGRGDVLRSAFGIELGHILLLKSFDGGEARLAPPFSKTALERFVSLEGRPLLFDFGPSTAQAIFGAGIHRHLLYLGRGSHQQNQEHCQTVSFPYMQTVQLIHVDIPAQYICTVCTVHCVDLQCNLNSTLAEVVFLLWQGDLNLK